MSGKTTRPAGSSDASFILLILIVLSLVGGIVFILTYLKQDPVEDVLSGDMVINTLFIFEDRNKPLASYVFMHYPATGKAAIFEVPGTVGLILKGIDRVDRIDTIYDPNRISPFEAEIEGLLGLEINFSMIINTEQLKRMVDLLEGVEIFIPSQVAVYDTGNMVFFPSGVTRLDGDKARSFITYEIPEEDTDQVTFRRQRFFLGLIKRLGEQTALLKNSVVASQFQTMIRTSMSTRVQMRFFNELAAMDTERMNIQAVGGTVRAISGQELLFPYYDGSLIKEIVRQSLGALTRRLEGDLTERVFTVEVLNGTANNGLAGRTADLLRSFGYDVISIGNADRNDYDATLVIDHSGFEDIARIFAGVIRCENIRFEAQLPEDPGLDIGINIQNLEYRADFTLIIGRDFNGRYVSGG